MEIILKRTVHLSSNEQEKTTTLFNSVFSKNVSVLDFLASIIEQVQNGPITAALLLIRILSFIIFQLTK